MKIFFLHTLPFIISLNFIGIVALAGSILVLRLLSHNGQQHENITLQEAGSFLVIGMVVLTVLGSLISFL